MKQRGRKPIPKDEGAYGRHRYTVYNKHTDMPVMIYATPIECAEAMGITRNSFYRYICRLRSGEHNFRDWVIYQEEIEEDDDE